MGRKPIYILWEPAAPAEYKMMRRAGQGVLQLKLHPARARILRGRILSMAAIEKNGNQWLPGLLLPQLSHRIATAARADDSNKFFGKYLK